MIGPSPELWFVENRENGVDVPGEGDDVCAGEVFS